MESHMKKTIRIIRIADKIRLSFCAINDKMMYM